MTLLRERRYRKEEDLDHLVQARWWLMKPIWDRQVFPQRLHVTIYLMFISEGSRFFSPSPFVFPVGPLFDFKGSGSLVDCMSPVRSIGCLYCPRAVIDVACDEGLFKVSLYLFRGVPLSRWPVDNSPYSMTFGRPWSSILETCPAQRSCILRSMTSMLVTLAISSTSMLVTKSLQCIFRMVRRQRSMRRRWRR